MLNFDVRTLLSNMTDNVSHNANEIFKLFGSLLYTDEEGQSILHILVADNFDEEKSFLAIKSLLQSGLSPNAVSNYNYNYNFIQTALCAGHSEKFILDIITESLKYGLDVNHVDVNKDTIMHAAIYSNNYSGSLEKIYDLLCENGFDSSLRNDEGRTLLDALSCQGNYSSEQIERFKQKFEKRYAAFNNCAQTKEDEADMPVEQGSSIYQTLSNDDILELEKYGRVLNQKDYIVEPAIGRDKELKNLMIVLAQDKKNPLIVGESGVGKTTIVDELAYRIINGNVPGFLRDKIILEVNPSDIVAGSQYVGMFEDKMAKLLGLCEELDVIIFIDEIHEIYGMGSSVNKDSDMASMLKRYIDRTDLKVIGITSEDEYEKYFAHDALKRRFEKVTVKEPIDEDLRQIVDKVIGDYYVKNNVFFEDESVREQVVDIILAATGKSSRVYNDVVNNPDLSISIVDRAFALAKFYDSEFVTLEHFVESFESCDRIYEFSKEQAIANLRSLDTSISKPTQKIFKMDCNRFKK